MEEQSPSESADASEPIAPGAWVSSLLFSDGTRIDLKRNEVVVIVGPNNAGKSASLRAIRDRIYSDKGSPVVSEVALGYSGTPDEVLRWIESFAHKIDPLAANPVFQAFGSGVHRSQVLGWWGGNSLHGMGRFFCHLLSADDRLQAANPAQVIAMLRDAPTHPLHYLYRDERLEARLGEQFRRAFGTDLVLNRLAGNQLVLHVGERPSPDAGEDRLSAGYAEKLERLDQLHLQGDGMRSFAGVLLHTAVGRESLLLIDEPEAFLHPPQARQLGRMLVEDRPDDRQVFIATHSGDVLRGILDAGGSRVRVVRLQRTGEMNAAKQLDNDKVAQLWNDPLLRYSNILDGVFHEQVVVCESDSDARFYAAVADSIWGSDSESIARKHVMFVHSGGKDRIHTVVAALSCLGVPVAVAADFDVLSAVEPLKRILEAAGGSWDQVVGDWKLVKSAIDGKKTETMPDEIKARITSILNGVGTATFPDSAREAIRAELKTGSPWAIAKTTGKSYVPSGDPMRALERLLSRLRASGIHVVEVGELECFDRTVGGHGPSWVNEVLKQDLASDPQLASARDYVTKLLGTISDSPSAENTIGD